jgi:hypothetical protein
LHFQLDQRVILITHDGIVGHGIGKYHEESHADDFGLVLSLFSPSADHPWWKLNPEKTRNNCDKCQTCKNCDLFLLQSFRAFAFEEVLDSSSH